MKPELFPFLGKLPIDFAMRRSDMKRSFFFLYQSIQSSGEPRKFGLELFDSGYEGLPFLVCVIFVRS